jgi:hypothetical protein
MGLYARGFDGGHARRPMVRPPLSDPRYAEIRTWLENGFETVGLELETGLA